MSPRKLKRYRKNPAAARPADAIGQTVAEAFKLHPTVFNAALGLVEALAPKAGGIVAEAIRAADRNAADMARMMREQQEHEQRTPKPIELKRNTDGSYG